MISQLRDTDLMVHWNNGNLSMVVKVVRLKIPKSFGQLVIMEHLICMLLDKTKRNLIGLL